jgi:hypothetical protein
MPDYSLGRAHGQIQIDYDGSGADKAAKDLDAVTKSSDATDKSLTKTQRTLQDTEKEFESAGSSADGYQSRLRQVESASRDVEAAERGHRSALLDSRSTLEDIKAAEDRVTESRKKHTAAATAARDAQKALTGEMSGFRRAIDGLSNLIPGLSGSLGKLGTAQQDTTEKAKELSGALGLVSKVALALGQPEIAAAAKGIDAIGSAASSAGSAVAGFAGSVAGFEVAFGKIAGLTLAVPSLAGLAGLGGGAALQGIVGMVDAAKQLSGALGLLPAVISGVELSMGTLQIALHGVDSALQDMMADDPKKFLEDIKNMGPVAAQAMLQVAQFRDQFKMAGATIQDSFFSQVAKDIGPLIQTLLPTLTSGMSKIAATFGWAADELARLLSTPAAQQGLTMFMDNMVKGLVALEPTIQPLFNIFDQLTVVGSGFFQQIGGMVSQFLGPLSEMIQRLASSGQLQQWIQDGINAFSHLINIAGNVGSAFLQIMDVADKFGGGGLLGWLDKLTDQFNKWTQSADGQKSLTDFFTVLRQATDALMPMLPPLVDGLASIGTAIVQMGVGTAPGWQVFFDSFAQTMAQLAPQLVALGPSLSSFLSGLGQAFQQLMASVGPELPGIFRALSDAFLALIPQVQPLVYAFVQLVEAVGPQLPGLFQAVLSVITSLLPNLPTLVKGFGDFVAILATIIRIAGDVVGWLNGIGRGADDLVHKIPGLFHQIMDGITNFFTGLPQKAENWGTSLIDGLVRGITNGLGSVGGAAKDVVLAIAKWFQSSPAKVGPFSGSGYTLIRGQKMVTDMAAGMASAQPAIEAAAAGTAAAASGALSGAGRAAGGTGGAPSPGGSDTVGGALLPDNIANADTSILTAYLRHQFSDTHGLKGLAKSLRAGLDVAQSGFNLLSQSVMQPLFQGLGMLPGANDQTWRKLSPKEIAAQQQSDLQKKAVQGGAKGPSWTDVFGAGAPGTATGGGAATPLGLSSSSSKTDIQKAIIAAGRARGLNDAAIQTALATAAAESGFDPTISGGVQGSAGLVSGLYQQSPSSGWGTLDQVNDPNHAINAFYDAFQKNLAKNPTDPQLAAVLTQNPQLGSGAKGSDYWNAISNQLGLANSIMGSLGPGVTGPTWGQVNGGSKSGAADYANWYPAAPTPAAPPSGTYGLPTGTDTGGYGTGNAKTFPEWVMAMAAQFGVKPSTYAGHQESDRHDAGYAPNPTHENRGIDWSGSVENMQRFAEFLSQNAPNMPGLEQIIWQNPNTMQKIGLGGRGNPTTGYYPDTGEGSYAEHQNHVHTRQSAPLVLPGAPTPLSAQTPPGVGASVNSGMVLPSGKTLGQLVDNTGKTASANDQLLQSYLQGNPELAQQISAAKTPGASDETVTGTLSGITKTIDTLRSQDAIGNKNTIDALQSTQSSIAQQQGFTQQPSTLSQAQSLAGGISGAVSGVFKSIGSGLDALAGTQDIADRLVYGVRNTEDINKIIDDVQKYITYAADIVSTAGSIVSTVGSFTGGADFGGTSAAGSALSLISSVLQGVNAAIDFGQQVYEVASGYVGRFMSMLTGVGGTDLMGNVGFLLNKNTGQLISYSHDNPEQKNTANVPSWMNSWYDYNGQGNPNPQVNQQLNVYAGPGQSPAQMMNETMWMVNTGGTTGALAPGNF